MAFVTTPPHPYDQWLWNNASHNAINEIPYSTSRQNNQWTFCGENNPSIQPLPPTPEKNGPITQSATQLNFYDNFQSASKDVRPGMLGKAVIVDQNGKRFARYPPELLQHRSMIELDTSLPSAQQHLQQQQAQSAFISNQSSPSGRAPIRHQFRWLRRDPASLESPGSSGYANSSAFMRFNIQDLIQQECYISPVHYAVDQPSRLVRIECRKPGCRCVLKDEPALALKIVTGVTLVQGNWLFHGSEKSLKQRTDRNSSNNLLHPSQRSHFPHDISHQTAQTSLRCSLDCEDKTADSIASPIILTSCCPSWFEPIRRTLDGPTDDASCICPDVPVWSSCKAVWRSKPNLFLLRKPVQCFFASTDQSVTMSSADVFKQEQLVLSIDADSASTIRSGTVLQLVDCRLCRFVRQDSVHGSIASNGLIGRHRIKTVSMLQCSIVGAKAIASVASVATDLSPQDAFRWFADGPRLVYLPLDAKSLSCSPVSVNYMPPDMNGKQQQLRFTCQMKMPGLHSLISMLSQFRLPVIARPAVGIQPDSCTSNEKRTGGKTGGMTTSFCEFNGVGSQPLIQFDSCYHGDLIFLEPFADCSDTVRYSSVNMTRNRGANSTPNSRFFVVTPDMLAYHNFFVADPNCAVQYNPELEAHASRVSHFLAACHPAQGLGYLVKHLENTTQCSNTGPSHCPLTRTLGPVGCATRYAMLQSTIASVAAAAAIATDDYDDWYSIPSYAHEVNADPTTRTFGLNSLSTSEQFQSPSCSMGMRTNTHSSLSSSLLASETNQMNALCDEIEDIYFYVRNGRFPTHSRSMTSLAHQITPYGRTELGPQSSAPISPQPFETGTGRLHGSHAARKYVQNNGKSVDMTAMKSTSNEYQSNPLTKSSNRAPQPFLHRKLSEDQLRTPQMHLRDNTEAQRCLSPFNPQFTRTVPSKSVFLENSTHQKEKFQPFILGSRDKFARDLSATNVPMVSDTYQPKVTDKISASPARDCREFTKIYTNTKFLNMSQAKTVQQNCTNEDLSTSEQHLSSKSTQSPYRSSGQNAVHFLPADAAVCGTSTLSNIWNLQYLVSSDQAPKPSEGPAQVAVTSDANTSRFNPVKVTYSTNTQYHPSLHATRMSAKPTVMVKSMDWKYSNEETIRTNAYSTQDFGKQREHATEAAYLQLNSPIRVFNLRTMAQNNMALSSTCKPCQEEITKSNITVSQGSSLVPATCSAPVVRPPCSTSSNYIAQKSSQPPFVVLKASGRPKVVSAQSSRNCPRSESDEPFSSCSCQPVVPPMPLLTSIVQPVPSNQCPQNHAKPHPSVHGPLPPTPISAQSEEHLSWTHEISSMPCSLHTSYLQLSQQPKEPNNSSPDTGIGVDSGIEMNNTANGPGILRSSAPWNSDSVYIDSSLSHSSNHVNQGLADKTQKLSKFYNF
ncbi:unnamed protein product [Calicophoron daubneyi]|uniref:Uncharacterized protein n=1 Tax=Calicophoron daubneyi TaxID=300641 RepID=A0AAV2TY05_CALDB